MNRRRQLFVQEYLVDLNATRAAERAGYSRHTAHAIGKQLVNDGPIAAAIRTEIEKRRERTRVTADRVVAELARVAFADLGALAEWGPEGVRLKRKDELGADERAAIAEISGDGNSGARAKLHDKMRALELLAKHLGLVGRKPGVFPPWAENPHQTAERVREVILGRLAKLAEPDPEDEPPRTIEAEVEEKDS
jgi:phage terminase small subunit